MSQKVPVSYSNQWSRPKDLVPVNLQEEKVDPLLVQLIARCTPSGKERHIAELIAAQPYVGIKGAKLIKDPKLGNLIVQVGENPETMFSCHMDIVDHGKINQDLDTLILVTPDPRITENINYSGMFWGGKLSKDKKLFYPSTVGADDKLGVWLSLKMIEQKIEGLYVFHTGEEVGGTGSSYLAKVHKERFANIKRAIAFDRAGYGDIITRQRGGTCCSDTFGKALAKELNQFMPPKGQFKSGITGTFTDTANYRDIIPECTNISVGYFQQHGDNEHFDWCWLKYILLPALLKVKWNELPTERDPKAVVTTYYNGRSSNHARKSWKDATPDTPKWQFPEWTIEQGYVEEANPDVLQLAVEEYIWSKSTRLDERKKFAKHILDLHLLNGMMMDDLIAKDAEINLLKKKLGISVVEVSKEEIALAVNNDEEIKTKQRFLLNLLEITDKVTLFGDLKQWIHGYKLGINKWLEQSKTKVNYTHQERARLNRMIYATASIIDMVALEKEHEQVLDEIQTYIQEHVNEEGWELPKKLQMIQNQTAIGIATKYNLTVH